MKYIQRSDEKRLGIQERLVNGIGKAVKPLIVNGVEFPMHSSYLFDRQKVYTEEPSRGLSGQIATFPEKFFVPYFTVVYNILPITEYSKMMKMLEADEVTVEYYDSFDNVYRVAKFYAQQPSSSSMQSRYDKADMEMKYGFIQNTQIVFAGTLGLVDEYIIEFRANGEAGDTTGTPPTRLTGFAGEEYEVPSNGTLERVGYVFSGWNDQPDGTGETYPAGAIRVFTANKILYAQWSATSTFALSLNFNGVSTEHIMLDNDIEKEIPTSISVTNGSTINGLPTVVDVVTTDNDNQTAILKDNTGEKVYTFKGWNTVASGNGSYISNGDTYKINGNSAAYAIYSIKEYTLTFYKEESKIALGEVWASVKGKYGTSFAVNEPKINGYSKLGWYYRENGEEIKFTASVIPAGNRNLYAKWQEG